VWSTDWWRDGDGEVEKLVLRLSEEKTR
jgi:hypothetical protein